MLHVAVLPARAKLRIAFHAHILASSSAALGRPERQPPTGNMVSPRFVHTLTRIAAGKALAAGGEDADVSVLRSSETYDLTSGVWLSGPDMTTFRATHTATLLPNGKVLVAGGFFIGNALFTAELYRPACHLENGCEAPYARCSWRKAASRPGCALLRRTEARASRGMYETRLSQSRGGG
jgi:hypothetical protein